MKRPIFLAMICVPAIVLGDPLKLKSESELQRDSHQICVRDWTKRGELDKFLYSTCMKLHANAYLEIKELNKYAGQQFYSEIAYPNCVQRFTRRGFTDSRMLSVCLSAEVEGFKDVVYYRKQYGTEKVDKIISENPMSPPFSWDSAAFVVKRYFEN